LVNFESKRKGKNRGRCVMGVNLAQGNISKLCRRARGGGCVIHSAEKQQGQNLPLVGGRLGRIGSGREKRIGIGGKRREGLSKRTVPTINGRSLKKRKGEEEEQGGDSPRGGESISGSKRSPGHYHPIRGESKKLEESSPEGKKSCLGGGKK